MDNNHFWNDKTVLITGHTGFKGSWLSIILSEMKAKVVGYSLENYTDKDNFVLSNISNKIIDIRGDIRDLKKLSDVFRKYKPEVVFHLAAQPLVRESYEKPIETYEINVIGTMNVLQCIREMDEKVTGVFITTDKCYENKEHLWGYREGDPLGGYDPYSSSKACCEILISSWRNSYFNLDNFKVHKKAISSVRAGNVIGGGDWSKDRIIPDCVRSLENEIDIKIRNPKSVRPWQHVIEPLFGYIMLAEKMDENPLFFSGEWNFGPNIEEVKTVEQVVKAMGKYYGKSECYTVEEDNKLHESKMLLLDITKARLKLGWKPILTFEEVMKLTAEWYKNYEKEDVYKLCKRQINYYISLKGERNE